MPYKSQAQRRYMHAQLPEIAARWDKEYPNQKNLPSKKKVPIVKIKKKSKTMGETFFDKKNKPTRVEINVGHPDHKKDKRELASTIKHELLHVKHPKMTEKEIYSKSAKTKISPQEQAQLLAKLRTKAINYKGGAIKRKLKIGKGTNEPGELISKMNESKQSNITNNNSISKERLAIMGLV